MASIVLLLLFLFLNLHVAPLNINTVLSTEGHCLLQIDLNQNRTDDKREPRKKNRRPNFSGALVARVIFFNVRFWRDSCVLPLD